MPMASKLGSLIALDPSVDGDRIEYEKNKVMEDAMSAQEYIQQLVAKHKPDRDANAEQSVKAFKGPIWGAGIEVK